MSQRECAGFNWPRFPVDAGEPLGAGPEPAKNTWSSIRLRPSPALAGFPAECPASVDLGVAQLASIDWSPSLTACFLSR